MNTDQSGEPSPLVMLNVGMGWQARLGLLAGSTPVENADARSFRAGLRQNEPLSHRRRGRACASQPYLSRGDITESSSNARRPRKRQCGGPAWLWHSACGRREFEFGVLTPDAAPVT